MKYCSNTFFFFTSLVMAAACYFLILTPSLNSFVPMKWIITPETCSRFTGDFFSSSDRTEKWMKWSKTRQRCSASGDVTWPENESLVRTSHLHFTKSIIGHLIHEAVEQSWWTGLVHPEFSLRGEVVTLLKKTRRKREKVSSKKFVNYELI